MERETTSSEIPSVVPIFPLPNVVLFPGTMLPLHIFELRYREMVRDSSRDDGLIGIALLQPGYEENYEGSPAIHPVGTVGRIEQLNPLPDGRYTLNLVGLERVEYDEIPSGKLYRLARVTPRPERQADESDAAIQRAKLDLLANQALLQRELTGGEHPALVVNYEIPFCCAVNGACANLPVAAEIRQELLLIDDLAERERTASRLVSEVLDRVLQLKNLSDQGGDLKPN